MEVKISCTGATVLSIDELTPMQGNLKTLEEKDYIKLRSSITEYGFSFPMFVWLDKKNDKNYIIDAHSRLFVLQKLRQEGWHIPKIPVDFIHAANKTEAKKKLLVLNSRYGKITESGITDFLNEPGFEIDTDEVADFLEFPEFDFGLGEQAASDIIEDGAPEVSKEPAVSQLGEVYQLGRHRLMCGDSTKIEDVEKLMNGQRADMVYTDPPYGISIVQSASVGGGGMTHFGSVGGGKIVKTTEYSPVIGDDSIQTAIDAYNLCASMEIKTLIFWGGNYYASSLPNSRCWVVWDKQNTGNFADCEMAWTNIDKSAKIYKQTWNGMVREGESEKRVHPTQKPVGLAFFCLTEFGDREDKVLDLFGGSGSTLIACEQTNRTCYMMELDCHYIDVIRKRYAKFIGQADNWQKVTPHQ